MYKVFCLVACLAVASAQVLRTAPAEEYDPNPSYTFSYEVQDPLTGDSKSQSESRQGDVVQGSYTLLEADGSRRIVDYTADPVNGFNADVRKEAAGGAVKVLKSAPKPIALARAPIALARAPLAVAHAPIAVAHAPIAYAHAPIAVAHAPVAYAHAPAVVHTAFNTPYATYGF